MKLVRFQLFDRSYSIRNADFVLQLRLAGRSSVKYGARVIGLRRIFSGYKFCRSETPKVVHFAFVGSLLYA